MVSSCISLSYCSFNLHLCFYFSYCVSSPMKLQLSLLPTGLFLFLTDFSGVLHRVNHVLWSLYPDALTFGSS